MTSHGSLVVLSLTRAGCRGAGATTGSATSRSHLTPLAMQFEHGCWREHRSFLRLQSEQDTYEDDLA